MAALVAAFGHSTACLGLTVSPFATVKKSRAAEFYTVWFRPTRTQVRVPRYRAREPEILRQIDFRPIHQTYAPAALRSPAKA